jgi:hypothetical protein
MLFYHLKVYNELLKFLKIVWRATINSESHWKMIENILLLQLVVFVHIVKQVILFSDLFMKLEMINHFLDAMFAEIIKSYPLRKGRPFKIEEGGCTWKFLPVSVSIFKASLN